MKEKIYCNWLKISLGIIFLGIILDIGVAVTDISLFTVTESYMDYIFAAIVLYELTLKKSCSYIDISRNSSDPSGRTASI